MKLAQDAPAAPKPEIKPANGNGGSKQAPAPAVTEAAPDQLTGVLAIAAALVALASLGIQVWMFL